MNRSSIAIGAALAGFAVLVAVQWWGTSPQVLTYGEFRVQMLAAVPALTVILSARWVEAGRREDRP